MVQICQSELPTLMFLSDHMVTKSRNCTFKNSKIMVKLDA